MPAIVAVRISSDKDTVLDLKISEVEELAQACRARIIIACDEMPHAS